MRLGGRGWSWKQVCGRDYGRRARPRRGDGPELRGARFSPGLGGGRTPRIHLTTCTVKGFLPASLHVLELLRSLSHIDKPETPAVHPVWGPLFPLSVIYVGHPPKLRSLTPLFHCHDISCKSFFCVRYVYLFLFLWHSTDARHCSLIHTRL